MSWTAALAWGVGALTPLEVAITFALNPARGMVAVDELTYTIQALVDALLAWRNPIGWIFVVTAGMLEFGSQNAGPAQEYALNLLATAQVEALAIDRLASASHSFATNIVIVFPLLLFPSGHLPSQRWRPLAIVQAGMAAFAFFWESFARPPHVLAGNEYANPLAIPALHDIYAPAIPPLELVTILIIFGAVVSLFRRYRRSRGDERQQLKWLALGGGLSAVAGATTVGVTAALDRRLQRSSGDRGRCRGADR